MILAETIRDKKRAWMDYYFSSGKVQTQDYIEKVYIVY